MSRLTASSKYFKTLVSEVKWSDDLVDHNKKRTEFYE